MSVTAKPLIGSDPANSNASNGPMNVLGTKEAVPAGGLSPVNCDRKGSTIISNHVDVLLLLLLLLLFFFKQHCAKPIREFTGKFENFGGSVA